METIGEIFKRYFVAHSQGLDPSMTVREIMQQMKEKDPQGFSRILRKAVSNLAQDAEVDAVARAGMIQEILIRDGIEVMWVLEPGMPDPCATFAGFGRVSGAESVERGRAAAMLWANGGGPAILVLAGPTGVGKTHLAQAAAHLATSLPQQRRLVYREEVVLKSELMAQMQERGPGKGLEATVREVCCVPWLVLDDMALTVGTAWWDEVLDRLINSRWQDRACRTLITTNVLSDDMPVRITSRLKDALRCRSIVINAPDYRVTQGRS